VIEAALAPAGFARTGTTPAGEFPRPKGWWLKVADNRFAVVWLQLDQKYGFSREWGGTFTLNFELSSRPIAIDDMVLRKRWWKLLDRSERKQALQIDRRVVAALPEPPAGTRKPLDKQLMTGHFPWEEVWARYATVEDVHTWAEFLKQTFPSTASRFLTKARAKAR
jgi:hypothetical protein